ncbi:MULTISPECIES: copper-binding protein [Pseudomonadota]|jgi:Cu(I)/Ag(I) efflux system protein CusF|nr:MULTISPECIES: copper-binding protein [Pseudomonadota]
MKIPAYLITTLLLAGCSQAPDNTEAVQAAPTEQMPMSEAEQAKTPAEASAAVTASATGTVQAVDAAASKITIAHGPVEVLQWPAMTMAFKATPEQIASVRAGQKVQFEFTAEGMNATIIRVQSIQ